MEKVLKTGSNHVIATVTEHVTCAADCLQFILTTISTDIRGADLVKFVKQWDPPQRYLSDLDFTNADMSECYAAGLVFSGSNFTRAIIRSGNFTRCIMHDCLFAGTIMDAAIMHNCDLTRSMFIETAQRSNRARHPLRPHTDEFLPFDRTLARSTNFDSAKLNNCLMTQVNFIAAMFENAEIKNGLIEKCTFEGAVFTDTRWDNSHVYRSDIVSTTLVQSYAPGAIFRSNDYIEIPVPTAIAEASFSFPRQLWNYIKEEYKHWHIMPREIFVDYRRVLVIKSCIVLSVPLLAGLAWKLVEINSLLSMISAIGAISTFALRRYFTMILQAVFGFAFGKANDAEGLWKAGHRGKDLAKLLLKGLKKSHILNKTNRNIHL